MADKSVWKQLGAGAIALVLLGAICLMGLAIVGKFGYYVRADTTVAYKGITVATNNSLTDFGATYPYVQTVTGCVNASNAAHTLNTGNYTVVEGTGANGGFILKDSGAIFAGKTVNCSAVTYKAATDGSNTAEDFVTGIGIFGAMIGILVLSLMGMVVIKMFKKN